MSGKIILLDDLKEYDKQMKETYIDPLKEQLVGKTDYLGTIASMTDLSTIAGAGDYHRVLTEFIYDIETGEMAHVGDILIAVIDNPAQTKEYWDLVHTELSSATIVTAGGEAQVSWDADTKLDKITSTYGANVHRIYAIGNQGQQYVVTTTDSNNKIATQKYVDDIADSLDNRIDKTPIIYTSEAGTENSITQSLYIYTDTDGYLHIKTS